MKWLILKMIQKVKLVQGVRFWKWSQSSFTIREEQIAQERSTREEALPHISGCHCYTLRACGFDMAADVIYNGPRATIPSNSSHLCWTKEMNHVSCLGYEEVFYIRKLLNSGYNMVLHLERKSVDLLQKILCRLTNPADLVFDACCGTNATSQACLLLPCPLNSWDVRGSRTVWMRLNHLQLRSSW